MKLLFVNPDLDAMQEESRELSKRGYGVLSTSDFEHAKTLMSFHGPSLDLIIVHCEGETSPGFEFIRQFKGNDEFADLPYVLTYTQLSGCISPEHQHSSLGANAYVKWPPSRGRLVEVIAQVLEGSEENPLPLSGDVTTVANPGDYSGEELPGLTRVVDSDLAEVPGSAIEFDQQSDGEKREILVSPDEAGAVEFEAPARPGMEQTRSQIEIANTQPEFSTEFRAERFEQTKSFAEVPEGLTEVQPEFRENEETPSSPDREAVEKMPYLYESSTTPQNPMSHTPPVGDAVVPGGAAEPPDVETLKKYLLLREQDVSVLASQLQAAKEQMESLEEELSRERGQNTELQNLSDTQEERIRGFEKEKALAIESLQKEVEELNFELKAKSDMARNLEARVKDGIDEVEGIKARVRTDIRKIRVREKELENQLEVLRKDSSLLMESRESKIVELKRKLDLTEFNMDLIQEKLERQKDENLQLRSRLARVAQAMRVAGGFLDVEEEKDLAELLKAGETEREAS